MTWAPDAPSFVVRPEDWGSAYASRYDPANGRTQIVPIRPKLVIHHSASNQPPPGQEAAFSRQLEAYGESRDGAACEYNYLLYPSGVLHGGFGDTRGCHASATDPSTGSAYNSSSIGICWIGYFHPPNNDQPTDAAISVFQQWLAWMVDSGRLTDDVLTKASAPGYPGWYGHRDIWTTACPGDVLYPLLPSIIKVGSVPSPTPIPPGDDGMALVIYESKDETGERWAWADFMGFEDAASGICESVVWIDGDYKAQVEAAAASPIPHKNRDRGGYTTFRLEGTDFDQMNAADQQYDWQRSDFRKVS